jgi:hypothetical protein
LWNTHNFALCFFSNFDALIKKRTKIDNKYITMLNFDFKPAVLASFIFLVMLSKSASSQEVTPPDSTSTPADTIATEASSEPVKKPYERFKVKVDSITNLVTYKAIIDQTETGADSFYVRAKKWADRRYALAKNKKMVLLDKPNEKLVLRASFPAYSSMNKNNRLYNGTVEFTLTLIFKDDKYKYIIDNLVYVPEQDLEKKQKKGFQPEEIEYFEFYAAAKVRVRNYDNRLKCSDAEINVLIQDLTNSLKNPKQVDEDDF